MLGSSASRRVYPGATEAREQVPRLAVTIACLLGSSASRRVYPGATEAREQVPRLAVMIAYAVIPFVSAMNAVSRLISSSLKSVKRWPASISSVGNSL